MLFKRRNIQVTSVKPAVESLLQAAHINFDALRTLRARVVSSGIDLDELPDDLSLRAFALFGDYDRNDVALQVVPHLALLMDKGLIGSTDIEALSTPTLRFFASIIDVFDYLLDNTQRIAAGIAAWQSGERPVGGPIIRAVDQISGIYGQEIHLKVYVSGAALLLVRPDPIFGLAETLLRLHQDCPVTIPKKLECDDGEVLIAAMSLSGDVSIHILSCSTLSSLPEAA